MFVPRDVVPFRVHTLKETAEVSLTWFDHPAGANLPDSEEQAADRFQVNIVERGEDTDGTNVAYISPDQVKDLEALISEVKADKARFLEYMGVNAVPEIPVKSYKEAVMALEKKRQK